MSSITFTPAEQYVLEQVCSACRAHQYDMLTGRPYDSAKLVDALEDVLLAAYDRGVTPQTFDSLYDRFHRQGVNR